MARPYGALHDSLLAAQAWEIREKRRARDAAERQRYSDAGKPVPAFLWERWEAEIILPASDEVLHSEEWPDGSPDG